MSQVGEAEQPDVKTVARAIRASHLLDAGLKRHWLTLLPYLTAQDRRDLWTILAQGEAPLGRPGDKCDA